MTVARILVVEDESILALHVKRQLSTFGYEVVGVAASGEAALQKITGLRPDMVLMDIHIEGPIDGIETAAQIPPELGIPVIYVTAYTEPATLERARLTKPYGYLVKPFSERELHAVLQMALERRRLDSDLRRSQQNLRLSEERFRSIFGAVSEGVWSIAADTYETLYLNPAAERIYGRPTSAFVADPRLFLRIVHPEDRARVAGMLPELLANGKMTIQYRILRPDGEVRWIEDKTAIARDGGERPVRFDGVASDITERKRQEAQLRAKQEQVEELLHALDQVPAMVRKLDGEILLWGRGLESLYGWQAGDAVGRNFKELLKTEAAVSLAEIEAELLKTSRWQGEFARFHKQGQRLVIASRWALYRCSNGEPASVVEFDSDITEARRAQAQLEALIGEITPQQGADLGLIVDNQNMRTVAHCSGTAEHNE